MQNQELRGTGRTRRLLEYALSQVALGKYVLIYYGSPHGFTLLIDELRKMGLSISDRFHFGMKIRFNGGELGFESINNDTFDWRNMCGRGVHPSVICLVDHHCIERRFPAVCNMLYKFVSLTPSGEWYDRIKEIKSGGGDGAVAAVVGGGVADVDGGG